MVRARIAERNTKAPFSCMMIHSGKLRNFLATCCVKKACLCPQKFYRHRLSGGQKNTISTITLKKAVFRIAINISKNFEGINALRRQNTNATYFCIVFYRGELDINLTVSHGHGKGFIQRSE